MTSKGYLDVRTGWSKVIGLHLKMVFPLCLMTSFLYADGVQKDADVAYLTEGLSALSYKDGRLAFEMWAKEFSEIDGLSFDVDFYDSSAKVLEKFLASKVNMVGVNPIFYFRDQQAYDTKIGHIFVATRDVDPFEKMVLLVRKDNGIDSLADLEGRRVARRDDNRLGEVFLDTELLRDQHVSSAEYIKEMILTHKNSTAILNTFFGKVDACVVPEFAFRLATEMNPGLGKDLHILIRSPAVFIPVLLLISKDGGEELFNVVKRSSNRLPLRPRGQNILALFKMRGLVDISIEQLAPSKKYFDEYLELKQRYGEKDE